MAGLRVWASGLSAFLLIGASVQGFSDYPYPAHGQLMPPIYAITPIAPRPYCPCIPEPPRYACPSPAPAKRSRMDWVDNPGWHSYRAIVQESGSRQSHL